MSRNLSIICLCLPLCISSLFAQTVELDLPAKLTTEHVESFMKEMALAVEKYHLKKDPISPQRGMVYEYVDMNKIGQLGQWIQGEGLDTMHDGAWYAAAMAQAYTATEDHYYRDFLTNWQMPFYLKMLLHSDSLFAAALDPTKRIHPAGHTFGRVWVYMGKKGWVPYWWDDGASLSLDPAGNPNGGRSRVDYYLIHGKQNEDNRLNGFSCGCSNHMAQDLAIMLTRSWLLLRDPDIALAAEYLQQERAERGFGRVPAIISAAAVCNQNNEYRNEIPTLFGKYPTVGWLFKNLRQPDRSWCNCYVDEEAFYYHSQLVKSNGKVSPEMASELLYRIWSFWVTNDYWYDVTGPIPGVNNLDLWARDMENGKFVTYQSDNPEHTDGSRGGCQAMIYTAIGLQMLDALPGCWERIAEQKTPDSIRIRFSDSEKNLTYCEPFHIGSAKVQAASTPWKLCLRLESPQPENTFYVYCDKSAEARKITIHIKKSGNVEVFNHDNQPMLADIKYMNRAGKNTIEVQIPYQIAKEQAAWTTAVESGYLSIGDQSKRIDLFTLSGEDRIYRNFLDKIEGGIAVWHKVFKTLGYIPTGFLYYPEITADIDVQAKWMAEKADSGGYAHLISACSQYLIYQSGRRDWQQAGFSKSWQYPHQAGCFRHPDRLESEILAFEQQDRKQPPPEGAIVAVGSSSMRGWHDTIEQDLEPLTIIPRGFGGSTFNELLYYMDRIVLKYKPRAVLIYEGDNDVAEGLAPKQIESLFLDVIETIHQELPETRIYVISVKPSMARWNLQRVMEQTNHFLEKACKKDDRLTYINTADKMLDGSGHLREELFLDDDLHMNKKGYQLWKEIVRPILIEKELKYEKCNE